MYMYMYTSQPYSLITNWTIYQTFEITVQQKHLDDVHSKEFHLALRRVPPQSWSQRPPHSLLKYTLGRTYRSDFWKFNSTQVSFQRLLLLGADRLRALQRLLSLGADQVKGHHVGQLLNIRTVELICGRKSQIIWYPTAFTSQRRLSQRLPRLLWGGYD